MTTLLDTPVVDDLDLFGFGHEPDTSDLRDPGLHPTVQVFFAQIGSYAGMVSLAPNRINMLLSVYDLLTRGALRQVRDDIPNARSVFLDSGGISALFAVRAGKVPPDVARLWLNRTDDLVLTCWQLHEWGCPPGVIAAMDLPGYPDLLASIGLDIDSAEEITLRNATQLLEADLPPGWRRVFTSQGTSLDDHRRCMEGYDRIGALEEIRHGRAWLAVGGMAFEKSINRVWQVHRMLREELGDQPHIHALGVTRPQTLVPMIRRGWVNSADSSSPAQNVRYNRHPLYTITGPRPAFLVEALHAVAALHFEAKVATDLANSSDDLDFEQGELFA